MRSISVYTAAGTQVKGGTVQIVFDLDGFTGTIGNASYSNKTLIFTLQAAQDGRELGAVSYTVSSGTLRITEVR
jgi:hypothetical protein